MTMSSTQISGSAALAAVAITAVPHSSWARFDPMFMCEVTAPQVIAADTGEALKLQTGDMVRVQYFHLCADGYCAAHIWAPNDASFSAWYHALTSDTSLLPTDKVEGRGENVTWHHANNGDRSDMVKIQLDCQSETGLH